MGSSTIEALREATRPNLAPRASASYTTLVLRWDRLPCAGSIVAVLGIALVALAPRVGRADAESPRSIDLEKIQVRDQGATAPLENGVSAELTLSPTLQLAAERLLARAHPAAGAAILVDVKSGRLLVFAELRAAGEKPGSVLLSASAPSASVFKIITTTALLERGKVAPNTRVCTWGGSHGIERRHLDPPRQGRSVCSPFSLALGHSRNAVFAQLATHRITRDDLVVTARHWGFDRPVPFDEKVLVGTLDVPYNDLEFARTAAGFRSSKLSPMGASYLASVVANGGLAKRFHLVKHAGSFDAPDSAEEVGRVMRASTAQAIERMMEVTVREGTSKDAFLDPSGSSYLPGIRVAGKTGTLQEKNHGPTASWFTGFAPSRQPEVIVTVLLLNGKVWRAKGNEVARDLLRLYFRERGKRGVTDPFAPEPSPARQAQR